MSAQDARVLACRAGGERLTLPAVALEGIQPCVPLTRVPRAPEWLLGMASLRGAPVPVVSLARLLGREEAPPGRAARLVLLRGGTPLALSVEAVLGLADGEAPLDLAALLARAVMPRAQQEPVLATPAMPVRAVAEDATLALLGCRAGGQDFAVPLEAVETVLRLPPGFAPLLGLGAAALGVVPYRGQALPLLALDALLGRGVAAPGPGARILVLRQGMARAGLVVEAVRGILAVPEPAVEPVPPLLLRGLRRNGEGQGGEGEQGEGRGRIAAIARLEEGRRLLPILAPASLLEGAAPAPAPETGQEAAPAALEEGGRVLLLRLEEQDYALPLAAVAELAPAPAALPRLPQAPEGLAGVMTLRGEPLPVLDLRRLLGLPAAARVGRVVVVAWLEGLRVALMVDAVTGLRRLPGAARTPVPVPVPHAAAGAAPLVEGAAGLPGGAGMALLLSPVGLLGEAGSALRATLAAAGAARAAQLARARAAVESAP
ncbi:chemotaxis protein CheW [Teichococcus aestuarii]|uniref:chemotaxis protein CheW n=1 Tax=Teichococcus aestuarii TaxID=568898 RepID=UPI003622B806